MTVESDTVPRVAIDSYRADIRASSQPVPPDFSIVEAACDRWEQDRVAMVDARSAEPRYLTFGWLQDQSRRLASILSALGVVAGSRVMIGMPQGGEAAIAHLATLRLGAISVPFSMLHGPDAVSARLEDAEPVVGIVDTAECAWLAEDAIAAAIPWIAVNHPATSLPDRWISYEAAMNEASRLADAQAPTAETPAVLIYTSGTTGNPKGALHAHRVVHAHAAPISVLHNGFPKADDVFWSPADWAWAGGLIDCLFAAFSAGRPIVAFRGRRFDPDEVMSLLAGFRVSNVFLPPTALRMMRDADVSKSKVSLRSIMTGGEPVDQSLHEWSLDSLGVRPNVAYGQTEASCVIGYGSELPLRGAAIGMDLPGSRTIVATEDGLPAPSGEVGEILVDAASPCVFLEYWRNPTATRAKVGDGWLHTGDLGRTDDDGYVYFEGRSDDLILSSGYRIGPAEIEHCLAGHPLVKDAAVIGIPDPQRGEVVKAIVELHDPNSAGSELAAELKQLVRTKLAPYETPRVVSFVETLPRTVTGKLRRASLREMEGESA